MKKINKKALFRLAEKLWKKAVLEKYQGKCFVCQSDFRISPHHFIPQRISKALRYDPENGVALCQKCHIALHWKSDPLIIVRIVFKKGKKWVNYLEKRRNEKIILNKKWLKEQIKKLEKYGTKNS